jgi:signal transduction histidine kinase
MGPEDLRRIFGKFVRVGGGYRMSRRTEGTGLGLYVTRRFVREAGRIEAAAEVTTVAEED